MQEQPTEVLWPDRIDQIARKYFFIWIWSIVVGMSTGTTFSLINYYSRTHGFELLALAGSLFALSGVCSLFSFANVLQYLIKFIIPTLADFPKMDFRAAQHYLIQAVRFSILGLAFRLLLTLADMALNANPFG